MKKCVLVVACLAVVAAPTYADEVPAARPRWQLEVQWWNDLFADPPPADDQGFTNDFSLAFAWALNRTTMRATVFHRMITERYSRRRWDQLDVMVAALRTKRRRRWSATGAVRGGVVLGGNFGGRWIQNSWHSATGTGPTIDDGLQDIYDGDRRIGLLLGTRVVGARSLPHARVYTGADGQLALGSTGVSRASAIVGVDLRLVVSDALFLLAFEIAGSRYGTNDPNLKLRGSYQTTQWQLESAVTLSVRLKHYSFGWQYRANEGGSHEPVGMLYLTISR